ncbi:PREDICTED: prolactin-inducible protein homolog [Chinchilla lanigera]|uniref:prolactin-inducible protein homolog n=1 Tax=Chinchilla lanigera TaxID=34839 RepID=UPI00038EAADD|nr:PREDICTED: prolactin-inducible protein homolog [Chinchilla lanigera]
MHTLQWLLKPNSATLLLVLCLSLGISSAQDEQEILSVDIRAAKTGENKYSVTLTVTNNMDKPMAVRVTIEDNPIITYPYGHFTYTSCVYDTQSYFWDIIVSESTDIVGTAEVVSDENICPSGEEQYHAVGYQVSAAYGIH